MHTTTLKSSVIYWFRNDLRLHDAAALHHAISLAEQQQTSLLPVFVHDTALEAMTPWGFVRTGAHRQAWLRMAIDDVSEHLASLGSQLLEFSGDPATVLASLSKLLGHATVICEEIAAPYEQVQIDTLRQSGVQVQTHWQSTLMSRQDLPDSPENLPDQFTKFRQLVEKPQFKTTAPAPSIQRLPKLPEKSDLVSVKALWPTTHPVKPTATSDSRAAFPYKQPNFHGGEHCALQHVQRYCERLLPHTYKVTRNGLQGIDYSTKWSPWLATGALSARTAWQAIQRFEAQHGANDSTYWIGFELLWRDHFRWLHLKHGSRLYKQTGLWPALKTNTHHDAAKFEAWRSGQTGHPFIDAGMRELNATGYTSNRMRQNLASFLIHDLGCDWRAGAAWFETQLIDYDVYSNQGNWLYLSGQGTDPRGSRRFNPDKQAHDYDPDGAYQRLWSAGAKAAC